MKKNFGKIIALVLVVAVLATVLCACVPTDPAKAKEHLKKNGYTVTPSVSGILDFAANLGINTKYEEVVAATNGDEYVSIYYFKNADDAKSFLKSFKDKRAAAKDELKKQKDAGKISEENYKKAMDEYKNTKVGRTGKAVYIGTKAGVKACN